MTAGMRVGIAVAVMACSVHAARVDERTLLLIPRKDEAVRIGLDIASRYPTLLLSYKLNGQNDVSLHGWTGTEWVNVTLDAYAEGAFFREGPDTTLLVEQSGSPFPEKLLPAEQWCDAVYKISTSDTRPLLHLAGQYFDFRYKDWKWFSENYHLPLEAINPENHNISWYHRRLSDNLKNRSSIVYNDLQYWTVVREPEPDLPVTPLDEEEPVSGVETNEPVVNPLTNEVPPAVLLTAEADHETNAPPEVATEPES